MWVVDVFLRNLTLLTVGAPYSVSGGVDVATIRIGGKVLIPGSSFKGAMRTAAHLAASRVGMTSCGEIEPGRTSAKHEEMNGPCDVCKIFGRPGLPLRASSAIRVTDLRPSVDVPVIPITRASIDPKRGKVQEGRLFTTEVIPLCTTFEGKIFVREIDHLKLVLASLDSLRVVGIGKGALVDVKASVNPEPDVAELGEEATKLLSSLKEWGWGLCQ